MHTGGAYPQLQDLAYITNNTSSYPFQQHLPNAIFHGVPLPGHSNYIGSEISVRSHYLYRQNDCGQDNHARNGTTVYTSIYPFQQHLPNAIFHGVPLPGHSNYLGSEISVRSHYLYCQNDCGQDNHARKGTTMLTSIYRYKRYLRDAI